MWLDVPYWAGESWGLRVRPAGGLKGYKETLLGWGMHEFGWKALRRRVIYLQNWSRTHELIWADRPSSSWWLGNIAPSSDGTYYTDGGFTYKCNGWPISVHQSVDSYNPSWMWFLFAMAICCPFCYFVLLNIPRKICCFLWFCWCFFWNLKC